MRDVRSNLSKPLLGACFEARDDDRLRVGRPQQRPTVSEEHAYTIDLDNIMCRPEVRNGVCYHGPLLFLRHVNPNFGRRYIHRKIGNHLRQGPAGSAYELDETARVVRRVVEAEVIVSDHDMPR